MNDFDVIWKAAPAVLYASDPYALPGVYYPFPFFFLFVPLAALPLEWARIAWNAIELVSLVAILRHRVLRHSFFAATIAAQVLVTACILTLGQRTVAVVLRVMELSSEKHFVNYHRVLNRARGSSCA